MACDCGHDHRIELILGVEQIKGWVAKALQSVFKGLKGSIEKNLFELESQNLVDAVETGMGGFQYNKPNLNLSLKLAQSGLWFAARKSYKEANDLAGLLDDNGTKRSWTEFKKLAAPIVGKYNNQWLKTEYETAVRSARMASGWLDIQRTADIYPNVEYMRTRSAEPRESHLLYVGIIRPINDAFWLTHLPPLAWLCKCWVKATKAAVTPIPEGLPEPEKGLANNAAVTESLFSEDHPYAINAKDVETTLRKEFYQARAEMGVFFKVKTPKGNIVLVHPGHTNQDVSLNLPAAVQLTDSGLGFKVELPTHFFEDGVSRPDLKLNGKYADLKEPGSDPDQLPTQSYKSIKKAIDSAAKQKVEGDPVSVVVLSFAKSKVDFTANDLERGLPRAFKNVDKLINETISHVLIIDRKGKVLPLKRTKILEGVKGLFDDLKL